MDTSELKLELLSNKKHIINLLEALGCEEIYHHTRGKERITCALPNGDNKQSVQVILTERLSTAVHTRNEYSEYPIKDVFTLICFIKGYEFPKEFNKAVQFLCSATGIEFNGEYVETKPSKCNMFLNSLFNKKSKEQYKEIILDEKIKEQFHDKPAYLFYEDNISIETQYKFGVMCDILGERIVFPIRNEDGKLLSFKGRTMRRDYKENDIMKYIYYYNIEGRYYLYGLYENYFNIMVKCEVIIFESEKSVMQCDTFGVDNTVAISRKKISNGKGEQLDKIISLRSTVVLALDKGVTLQDIFIECRKFGNMVDVYYIYDYDNLLGEKESPSDRGEKIFKELYNNYKFKYKGE